MRKIPIHKLPGQTGDAYTSIHPTNPPYIYIYIYIYIKKPRRYPYFDVVVGLAWSHDPKSYAGGSVCYW
jgi:hypothetical protein